MRPSVLRVPGYGHWLVGRCLSWFGDMVMVLVLSMWMKQLTGSSSRAGVTLAFYLAPSLLAPLAGILVDRWRRRTVLVLGNLLSAVVLVPLFWVRTPADSWIIWAVTLLYGVSGVFLPAASMAMQRSLVPDDLLADAQGLQQTIAAVFQIAGPLAGAALFAAWGGVGPTVLAICCFLAGAAMFVAFRRPEAPVTPTGESVRQEMVAGLRHVWRTRPLFDAVVALLIVQAVAGLLEGAMYSVTDTFHLPATWASSVAAAQSIGMVVGALGSARVIRATGESRAMSIGLTVAGLGACAAAAAPTIWIFLGIVAALGIFLPMVFVAAATVQQQLTPQQLMGRVTTATAPLFTLATVASMGLGALLVRFWSFREMYPLVGAGCVVAAGYLALARIRERRRLAAQESVAPGA